MTAQRWTRLWVVALVIAAAMLGVWVRWQQRDRTDGVAPLAVAQAAAREVLSADRYRFTVTAEGSTRAARLPRTVMQGEFRRAPRFLHLTGAMGEGAGRLPLEYYLTEDALYARHPQEQRWHRYVGAQASQMRSFRPDELAQLLQTGVRSATVVDHALIDGQPTVHLALKLGAGAVSRLVPSIAPSDLQASLWINTRTLRPTHLQLTLGTERSADYFAYAFTWEFGYFRLPDLPEGVKALADDSGGAVPLPVLMQ